MPVQLPFGSEDSFDGVIDLIEMQALSGTSIPIGTSWEVYDIPAEYAEAAAEARQAIVEAVADHDDAIMHAFLEDEDVDAATLRKAVRACTLDLSITPVLCGSAFKNKGVQPLLDAIVDYLPSPLDVPPVQGRDPRTDVEITRAPSLDEPFSALAFKVMSDPYVGKLTYFRVYSGVLKAGSHVTNVTTGRKERVGRILQMHANSREERESVGPGEIAAAVGLKQTTTGDTLSAEGSLGATREHHVPRAGHRRRRRAQDEGRPGQARDGARSPVRGGSDLPGAQRRGDGPDRSSPAWASCTSRSSSTG